MVSGETTGSHASPDSVCSCCSRSVSKPDPRVNPGGMPTAWTEERITKTSLIIDNLMPGTTYAFQVRAFGRSGSTDWSDAVIRIAV